MNELLRTVPSITNPLALVAYGGLLILAGTLGWLAIQRRYHLLELVQLPPDHRAKVIDRRRGPSPNRLTGAEYLEQLRQQYRLLLSLAVLVLFFALAGIVASIIARQQESQPRAGCVGADCNGKDADAMGCSATAGRVDFVEVRANQGQVLGRVELRSSGLCGTFWSRLENSSGDQNLRWRTYIRDDRGTIVPYTEFSLTGLGGYGDMQFAPPDRERRYQACGVIGNSGESCTDLH
jgi:hypothetical protein